MKNLMLTFVCTALVGWPFHAAVAQVEEMLMQKAVEVMVDEIPTILLGEEDMADTGGPIDTTFDWTAIWRSSDLEGERRTHRSGPDDWEVRPRGKRIGCICMDGTEQRHRGRGACAGRGGVRYWKFETPEGKEMTHPTRRHFAHPDPLTGEEKMGLAAYNEEKEPPSKRRLGNQLDGFVSLAIVLASTTMVVYYMRAILDQRRRPGKRKKRRGGEAGGSQGVED